jgi:hypothetical protein
MLKGIRNEVADSCFVVEIVDCLSAAPRRRKAPNGLLDHMAWHDEGVVLGNYPAISGDKSTRSFLQPAPSALGSDAISEKDARLASLEALKAFHGDGER